MMSKIWSHYRWAVALAVILIAGGGIVWSKNRD